jgi:hypothetical protein
MLRDCEEVSVLLAHLKALNPNEKHTGRCRESASVGKHGPSAS